MSFNFNFRNIDLSYKECYNKVLKYADFDKLYKFYKNLYGILYLILIFLNGIFLWVVTMYTYYSIVLDLWETNNFFYEILIFIFLLIVMVIFQFAIQLCLIFLLVKFLLVIQKIIYFLINGLD